MTPSRPAPRFSRGEAMGVLAAALLVRALFLAFYRTSPFFAAPILDSAMNDGLARALASGHLDAGAPYFRPPLYPWLLGAVYAAAGTGPWAGRVLNALLGAGAAVGVLEAARRLGLGRKGRLGAAAVVVIYAPELFLEGELLGTPLAVFLTAWGLAALLAAWERAGDAGDLSLRGWLGAGALWGLAALARAPLALLPLGGAFLAAAAPRLRLRRAGALAGAALALWAGPAILMASHGAGFRFPATQGGINFYVGNHPGADGRGVSAPGLEAGGWRDFAEASVRAAGTAVGRPLTPAGASRYWTRKGVEFWREHPGEALALTAAKAVYLIHGYETPNNRSLYAAREDVPWLGAVLWRVPGFYWPTGLLLPLALAGAWTVRRRRAWRPVLLTALLVLGPLVLFFVCARFRTPALPALALLAAPGATALFRRSRGAWAVFLAAYLAANIPWPGAVAADPARDRLARAEALLNAGRTAEAAVEYRRVLVLDPAEGRAHLGLAVVADRRGDPGLALAEADSAATTIGNSWELQSVWAGILEREGRTAEAAGHLARAAKAYPENPDLWGRWGLALEALGKDDDAWRALEEAARRGSRDPEVWNSLGRYRRLLGERPAALAAWDRALALDPNHFKARFNRGLFHAEDGERGPALRDLEAALAAAPDSASAARARRALALARSRLP